MSRSTNRRDTSIPRRPLLWMAAALLFTLPPFFDSLAIWVPWLFLLSLALKFWMEPRGYRLRSTVLKLLLVATALTIAFISYGSVKGVEAGISLLVVLMSLKILEAHTAREFRVMVTDRLGALFVWIIPVPGFRDGALSPRRLCVPRSRINSVSSWSIPGRGVASGQDNVQTPPSGLAACRALFPAVSPYQPRVPV